MRRPVCIRPSWPCIHFLLCVLYSARGWASSNSRTHWRAHTYANPCPNKQANYVHTLGTRKHAAQSAHIHCVESVSQSLDPSGTNTRSVSARLVSTLPGGSGHQSNPQTHSHTLSIESKWSFLYVQKLLDWWNKSYVMKSIECEWLSYLRRRGEGVRECVRECSTHVLGCTTAAMCLSLYS